MSENQKRRRREYILKKDTKGLFDQADWTRNRRSTDKFSTALLVAGYKMGVSTTPGTSVVRRSDPSGVGAFNSSNGVLYPGSCE